MWGACVYARARACVCVCVWGGGGGGSDASEAILKWAGLGKSLTS